MSTEGKKKTEWWVYLLWILAGLVTIGLGTAVYLHFCPTKKMMKKYIIDALICEHKKSGSDPTADIKEFQDLFPKFSDQELHTVWLIMKATKNGKDHISPDLERKMNDLTTKYGIFG